MPASPFKTQRLAFTIGTLAILVAAACNSGSKSGAPQAANNSSPQQMAGNSGEIIGAGSTFIYPAMTRWIAGFQGSHPGVRINYQSIGSGGGIQQLKKGLVDFGASDAALDDQQLKEMAAVVQIPESAGPVCITYNLPELKTPLKLSAETLAGIYLGKIKKWQDDAIKKDNPGVDLPSHDIVVAHRSDGSGTTNIFTTYLAKVSPDWQKQVGKGISVSWPAGVGGKGSEGVTGVVKQMPGGIGYVELTYAKENKLPVASVRNQAGAWVEPTAQGTTAAIDAFQSELAKDVRTPIVDPPASAKDAYPIAGLTFLIVPKEPNDARKGETLKQFIQYIVTQGQDQAESLSYAKLPGNLQQQDQNLLSQVGTQGQHNQATLKSSVGR
ncbi:MAG: phosphate ABC transporter substrate-binding protein PstS [Acidobacteria bacterium]|nr:phosphate ABC transporter substrate-binding protein PstS [Acidobacteriota bacterium]